MLKSVKQLFKLRVNLHRLENNIKCNYVLQTDITRQVSIACRIHKHIGGIKIIFQVSEKLWMYKTNFHP